MLKENSWHEGGIKRRMKDWIYMHVVFGSPGDQPFLMSRFVTRMLNPVGTSSRSKYIVYTRMRKSVNTQIECSRSNCNIHPSYFYNKWWNGKGVLELPQQTSKVGCYQERRGLRQKHLMDTSKNLLCTSEIRINLSTVRKSWHFRNTDIEIENTEGAIYWLLFKGTFRDPYVLNCFVCLHFPFFLLST